MDNNRAAYSYINSGWNDLLESISDIHNLKKDITTVRTDVSLIEKTGYTAK